MSLTGSVVFDGIIYLAIIVVVILVFYFMYVSSTYKIKFRLRKVLDGRNQVFDDRAKRKVVDGVAFYHLLKEKRYAPIPPEEAIDIDATGALVVEAFMTSDGKFQYIKDNAVIGNLQPLNTEQRQVLINQIRKAEERKGKKWQDFVIPITGIMALVIIVVSLLIFYENIAVPVLEQAKTIEGIENIRLEQLKILKEIKEDVKIIGGEKLAKFNTSAAGLD